MGQTLLLPIHRKLPILFQLVYLDLTLTHSRGLGQMQFDCEKLSHVAFHCMSAFMLRFLVFHYLLQGAH